jgi:hypothetical protein
LLGQLHRAENRGDEGELSHLDADVEREQRDENVALRKASFTATIRARPSRR